MFLVLSAISSLAPPPLVSQSAGGEVVSLSETEMHRQFWAGVDSFQAGQYQQAAHALEPILAGILRQQETAPSAFPLDADRLASAANLYSLSLIRLGRQEEGFRSFSDCHRQGILGGEGLLNYSRAALEKKDYPLALRLAQDACASAEGPSAEAGSSQSAAVWLARCKYVAALAAFGLGDWFRSERLFEESRSQDEAAFEANFYHQYYLALARFRQNKLAAAYQALRKLHRSHRSHPAAGQAARLAIQCALQLWHSQDGRGESSQWWSEAAALAQELVDSTLSPGPDQSLPDSLSRHQAVLLAARIYSDGGRYQKARSLLEPYLERRDEPALSCRFLAAEILASQGKSEGSQEKLERAAAEYGRLAEIGSPSQSASGAPAVSRNLEALGGTASYRQGELLYALGKYGEAAQAFSFYRRNYPAGSHGEAALYFNGEALGRDGFPDQAILLHEALLARHPESSFAFSSRVALMDLYKAKGEYALAAEQGRLLQEQFPQQARTVDVEGRMETLSLLERGAESGIVELLRQYRAAGACGTREGRRLAVELAARSISSGQQVHSTEQLLLQLLDSLGVAADAVGGGSGSSGGSDGKPAEAGEPPRPAAGEELVAARGSYLLAGLYRQQDRYQESARLFLVAARLFLLADAGGGDDGGRGGGFVAGAGENPGEAAAAALYRGAESFDVAGMGADCRAVARQLESLFPQSRWAEAARMFL